jgi:hypothetical protein
MKHYGEIKPNLIIHGKPADYPVVNEREIRAAAGIMFLVGIVTFLTIIYTKDYTLLYVIVPLFWLEFFLKAILSPKASLFGLFGGWMVKTQEPEYVGAIQKRFAWALGLIMATAMMILAIGLGFRGPATLSICVLCLFFMWLESAAGICVGCSIYKKLLDKKIIPEPSVRPACPGGVCTVRSSENT